jgi:wyosine [tRNA(Phe)-imidazoG37] synthetase (radical SAM superfamily)
MRTDRRAFYDPEAVFRDVKDRLAEAKKASERVDYLAFVPDGEPTLDANLGREISLLKALGTPVAVITNGSLLWLEDVRKDLALADWVSVKVDAVQEEVWRKIDRPHKSLMLTRVLDGIRAFAQDFVGRLVTETMLVRGINDDAGDLEDLAEFLGSIEPDTAYLSIPTRPPAEAGVRVPDEGSLNRAFQILSRRAARAELLIGYEGDAFAATGAVESDLLGITAVHPMREDAVRAFLARAGSSWEIVERLVGRGDLVRTEYNGQSFYLRRFAKRTEPAP